MVLNIFEGAHIVVIFEGAHIVVGTGISVGCVYFIFVYLIL